MSTKDDKNNVVQPVVVAKKKVETKAKARVESSESESEDEKPPACEPTPVAVVA